MRRRAKARYHVLMPDSHNRVAIDRIDWASVLPVLRLVSAFRNALQPGKLIIALIAVILIHLSGLTFDALLGVNESNDGAGDLTAYESLVYHEAGAFRSLVYSALALEHGFGPSSDGVADALYAMIVAIPRGMFDTHPWFTLLFGIDVLVVLALASGMLCRMAATQVCSKRVISMGEAACFVSKRWAWYLLTPLMPALFILLVAGVLILAGLVFFNVAYLEVIGSLGYGLLLLLGFVIALVSLLLILALYLMAPALSVEASDGFDAIARSFNYVMFRPWQFAAYIIASVAYLAVVYVLVGALAGGAIEATNDAIDVGAFVEADEREATRYEVITTQAVSRDEQGVSLDLSSWIVARWYELLAGFVAALMFSLACCLQTQVYVLMRRSADGTPLDQLGEDESEDLWEKSVNAGTPEMSAAATTAPSGDADPQSGSLQAGD